MAAATSKKHYLTGVLVRRTLARLAAFRGDVATALAHLTAVESLARDEGLLPDLAWIQVTRSELLGTGSPDGSAALEEARRLSTSLGMSAVLRDADTLASVSVAPRATLSNGLTAREIEVLRLLAQGKANREIAGVLVISEHTVVNHISHIFGKIGVDNRTGAAGFAHRQGIV